MSIEINRFIRLLNDIAEENKGADLFVKVYNAEGDLVTPDLDQYSTDNDYRDRILIIEGDS